MKPPIGFIEIQFNTRDYEDNIFPDKTIVKGWPLDLGFEVQNS